jgi:hypothetical protein
MSSTYRNPPPPVYNFFFLMHNAFNCKEIVMFTEEIFVVLVDTRIY